MNQLWVTAVQLTRLRRKIHVAENSPDLVCNLFTPKIRSLTFFNLPQMLNTVTRRPFDLFFILYNGGVFPKDYDMAI